MAKINHNNHLDTIDTMFTNAKDRGIVHLTTGKGAVTGRKIEVGDQDRLNFGSLSYLALEHDPRLKEQAIQYIQEYGTQSVMSRTYILTNILAELEEAVSKMFGHPALVYSRTSAAHISLLPSLVDREDAIILDQQAHFSMQTAAQLQRQRGVTIEMIRHSNLEMLDRMVTKLSSKHKKIWYMADGVYSMFGDALPAHDLVDLLDKHPQLYLYVDDAHGVSWAGPNGTGYVFGEIGLHPKMMLVTTMAKGFGVHGGIAVFPNEEWYRKVKVFGGPLSYSLPLSPGDIGACMASAQIHNSDEIYKLQHDLRTLVKYTNRQLEKSGLPVVSNPSTPIFFVGMGQPGVGYNMVKRLMDDGIYINASFFPMVPVKHTGIRFGLTRDHTKEDIRTLIDAMVFHFPRALQDEGRTENQVRKAFNLSLKEEAATIKVEEPVVADLSPAAQHQIEHFRSIQEVDAATWNTAMADRGVFDWEGMRFMETAFSGNDKPEENWDFHYYLVRDKAGKVRCATFFTAGIFKDDFVALPSISAQIENRRKSDPYYLASKSFIGGSMISLGEHLYIDRSYSKWREVLNELFDAVGGQQDLSEARSLVIGDFDANDTDLKDYFLEKGFLKIDMPNANVVSDMEWDTFDQYLEGASANARKNLKKEVLRFEHLFDVDIKNQITASEADYYYQLFLNVKRRNFGLNFYDYPVDILQKMSEFDNWEFLVINLKPEHDSREEALPLAALWCYRTENGYHPMIIGMDYDYLESHKLYKQALYRVMLRARELNVKSVQLGFSADVEKRKFGAEQNPRISFMQAKDNFNLEVIASMGVLEAS
ncbi:MAG: aminotransferase class I/II-fold pyridoxal phosphate-dependent enzyme [Salibacteraceae bacterium]